MRWITAVLLSVRAFTLAALTGSLAQAQQPADADDSAWRSMQQLGTAKACQQYLEQFPAGRHVEDALHCLMESGSGESPAAGPGGMY
jgi:hypothetical protein